MIVRRDIKQFTVNTDDGEEGYKTITTVRVVGAAKTTALFGADSVPGPVKGAAHTFSHSCFTIAS